MINYSIPDRTERRKNVMVEVTMIHSGAKSLVERCISFLKKLQNEDFDLEIISILVDHGLIANGLESIVKKCELNP